MQSILTGLVLAAVLWMANSTAENSEELARMSERVVSMQVQIADLKAGMNDRFTAADGKRLEDRVQRNADAIRILENGKH